MNGGDQYQAWCNNCNRSITPYFDTEGEARDHALNELRFCDGCGAELEHERDVEVINVTKAFGVRPR